MILDVNMPGMSGWELCAILRRQSTTRGVPILFLTGRQELKDRITAMQLGGSDYLAKPFGADELRRKVRAVFARRAARETGGAMSTKRRTGRAATRAARGGALDGDPTGKSVDRLRQERLVYDGVTGLPLHPFEDPERVPSIERIERLGVIYLQIGKFFGFEELYGWELYDRVLRGRRREGLRSDVQSSRLAPYFVSLRYSGSDGFYVLFDLPSAPRGRSLPSLEEARARAPARRDAAPAPDLRRHDRRPHERARLEPLGRRQPARAARRGT